MSPAPNFGILLLLRKPRFMLRVLLMEDDILTRVLAGFSTDTVGDEVSGVNFDNILRAAFAPIFLHRKIKKPNCNYRKAVKNIFTRKRLA